MFCFGRTRMRPQRLLSHASVLLALAMTACTVGDERLPRSPSPLDMSTTELARFQANECKKADRPLFTGAAAAPLAGLACVAWSRTGERLLVDLINYGEACGFSGLSDSTLWKGGVSAGDDGNVQLEVGWDFPSPNACGECLHDFSFELLLSERPSEVRSTLSVRSRPCSSCTWTEPTFALPIDESAGVACSYAERAGWTKPADGSLHGRPQSGRCDDGLVRIAPNAGVERCVRACTTDADCGSPALLCRSGGCTIAHGL
jgi:hypothetical protein